MKEQSSAVEAEIAISRGGVASCLPFFVLVVENRLPAFRHPWRWWTSRRGVTCHLAKLLAETGEIQRKLSLRSDRIKDERGLRVGEVAGGPLMRQSRPLGERAQVLVSDRTGGRRHKTE
jgi:hypothetical protein